jgi:hypothetical protein
MPPTLSTYLLESVHYRNRTKGSTAVDDKYNFSSDFSTPTDIRRKLSIDFSTRVQRILTHARSYTSPGQHKLRSKPSTTHLIAGPEYVQSRLPFPFFRTPPPALCSPSVPTSTKDTKERIQTYRRNSRKILPFHTRSGSVLGTHSVTGKIVTPQRPSRPAGKDFPFTYDLQPSRTQEEWKQQKPNQAISMVEGYNSPPARPVTSVTHGNSPYRTRKRSYKLLKQLNDAPIPPFMKSQSTAHMPGSTSRHYHGFMVYQRTPQILSDLFPT